jgi:type II secretory pathway pseudopilin PulG
MPNSNQKGMALIAINILVLIAALTLLLITQSAKQDRQRIREQELMFIGMQFVQALESYAKPIDAAGVQLPNELKDLLIDTRAGIERRHLRRIYDDPMTGLNAWGLIRNQNGIVGVHSTSQGAPLRKAGFSKQHDHFKNAKGYHEWVFQLSVQPQTAQPQSTPKLNE